MLKFSLKVVKTAVIAISLLTLVSCGGGSSSLSSDGSGTSEVSPTSGGGSSSTAGTGTATVRWTAPTTYTDGSSLSTLLSGHHIYMDSGSGFKRIASVTNPSISIHIVENLDSGDYVFAVSAFDSNGVESALSVGAALTVVSS